LIKFLKFIYRVAKKIIKCVTGYPLTTPPLGSGTLDIDDVNLAKRLLKEQGNWFDSKIVQEYENAFSKWNETKHSFAFMGGRIALSACIYALDLQEGDEVILPGYTCIVVSNAFNFAGIKIIYSDIELDTYGLDVSLIEEKITPKTRAILLHHLYGLVCRDYEAIVQVAKKHGLKVIEDCAQSTGAMFKDRKVGNLGDVAIYSTEQSKVFTTIQGGIASTNDDGLALRLKEYYERADYPGEELVSNQLYSVIINYYSFKDPQRWWKRDFIRSKYGDKVIITTTEEENKGIKPGHYGCKMPAAVALIGLNQLKKVDHYNQQRRETAKKWSRWCQAHQYKEPVVIKDSTPVFLRYPVLVEPERKKDISWALRDLRISLGVWFLSNLHPSEFKVEGCPNADKAVKQCVNFPGLI